jgi:ubiquinone/menaquinone biosynthesis C-methylase UbiE
MDRLELKEGAKILEVGIGTGDNLPYLHEHLRDFETYGVDISGSMLRRCAGNLKKWKIETDLFLAQAERLPFKAETFDVVFHLGAINFFSDKKGAIEEMIRVARPQSKIVLADESEKALKVLDKFLLQLWIGRRETVVPPVDLVPQTMLDVRLDAIWRGYGYCIEFRTPPKSTTWGEDGPEG